MLKLKKKLTSSFRVFEHTKNFGVDLWRPFYILVASLNKSTFNNSLPPLLTLKLLHPQGQTRCKCLPCKHQLGSPSHFSNKSYTLIIIFADNQFVHVIIK